MDQADSLGSLLNRIQRRSLFVGLVSMAAFSGWGLLNPEGFFRAYLVAYLFWIGIALGSLGILMLHQLVGGCWGFIIRRLLEAGTRTFPLMALLFLPILFGMNHIFIWTDADLVARDHVLQHKSAYLNIPFFTTRAIVYFLLWIGISSLLSRWSLEQDRTGDPLLSRRMPILSGPGLVIFGLTATFASIDWVMSLEPHWFSTMHGVIFIVGQALATLAFSILCVVLFSGQKPLSDLISPKYLRDLGTMMLAFVMLWAYVTFSQYLIIWSGNLPEEIPWYLHRTRGVWTWVTIGLILFHFALPFTLLISRNIKRRTKVLTAIAGMMLLVRLVDVYWFVVPSFGAHGLGGSPLHIMDLTAPLGIGGIWFWFFARELEGKSLLPLKDPRMEEAFAPSGDNHG